MYHKHQTEGIILKGYDSGDSSRKVALLTQDLGLIYAHVQNARGLISKLRGNVQEFVLGRFVLVKGSGGWKLVGGEVEQSFHQPLRGKPAKLKIFANIFNLVRSLVGEGAHAEDIYEPLKKFCLNFSAVEEGDEKLAEYAVLLKILHELGYLSRQGPLEKVIADFNTGKESLAVIARNREMVVASINQALKAAHAIV